MLQKLVRGILFLIGFALGFQLVNVSIETIVTLPCAVFLLATSIGVPF